MSGALALNLHLSMMLAAAQPAAGGDMPVDLPREMFQEDEILVLGRKLDHVTLNIRRDENRQFHCSVAQSSGIADLDVQLCRATVQCVRKVRWEQDKVKQCVEKAKPALLDNVRQLMVERRAKENEDAAAREDGA